MYINPRPTNAVIFLNKENEILLVKRSRPPKKDYWDLPGGFVDIGETLEQSVRREIQEEMDCTIGDLKLLGSYTGTYRYKGINYATLCFVFIARFPNKPLTRSDEFTSMRFFSKKKIPWNRIAFVDNKKALHDYLL